MISYPDANQICAKVVPFENDTDVVYFTLLDLHLDKYLSLEESEILSELLHSFDFHTRDLVYLYNRIEDPDEATKTLYKCIQANNKHNSTDFYWGTSNYFKVVDSCFFYSKAKVSL